MDGRSGVRDPGVLAPQQMVEPGEHRRAKSWPSAVRWYRGPIISW
jgi:hypothetical protein